MLLSGIAGLVLLAVATPTWAKDKEVTISGEAKCAKCALKQSDKCQTVIQSENKKGKMVTYYLANNDVAKGFHDTICSEPKKVTATGTVKKVNGKEQLTASKIDVVSK